MLKHKLRIFIPTKDREGSEVPRIKIKYRIKNTLYTLSNRFESVTSYPAENVFVTDDGEMIKEIIRIVEVFSDSDTLYVAGEVQAGLLATVDNHEKVMFEYDGEAYFAENWKTERARERW